VGNLRCGVGKEVLSELKEKSLSLYFPAADFE
jgi:hypothetical protein